MGKLTPARWLIGAVCIALLATVGPTTPVTARAQGALPAERADGDTWVEVTPSARLQLIKRADSRAKPGTTEFVGKRSSGRRLVSRLLYSFDLAAIPAESITQVLLQHHQYYSPNSACNLESYGPPVAVVTTAPFGARTRWPGPAVSGATPVRSGYAVGRSCYPVKTQTWDVTDMVRTAALASPTVHLRLASADERKKAGYRKYATNNGTSPSLRVYLRPHPDTPSALTLSQVAPKSPETPVVTSSDWPRVTARLTSPGGCQRTPVLMCIGARWERSGSDGSLAEGEQTMLSATEEYAELIQGVGPLTEGVDYVLRVWAVNEDTGLESGEPASLTFRYDAPPGAPEVEVPPDDWTIGEPVEVGVTASDADVETVCWNVRIDETPQEGCAAVQPGEPIVVTLGTSEGLGMVDGTIWAVDRLGITGHSALVQGFVSW